MRWSKGFVGLALALALLGSASVFAESVFDGSKGNCWADPKDKASCSISSTETHDNKPVAVFKAKLDKGWTGGGVNWFSWYPSDAGTDVSGKKNLVVWLKVTGDAKPGQLNCSLASSGSKKASKTADLAEFVKEGSITDGEWHKVTIPLDKFKTGDDAFDPAKVWQFNVGSWSNKPQDFTVYIGEISFE